MKAMTALLRFVSRLISPADSQTLLRVVYIEALRHGRGEGIGSRWRRLGKMYTIQGRNFRPVLRKRGGKGGGAGLGGRVGEKEGYMVEDELHHVHVVGLSLWSKRKIDLEH